MSGFNSILKAITGINTDNLIKLPIQEAVADAQETELKKEVDETVNLLEIEEVEESAKKDLISIFQDKNIKIDISNSTTCVKDVEDLASSIAKNYHECKPFIMFIRENVSKKRFKFSFSLSGITYTQREQTLKLASDFSKYGVIFKYEYNKHTNSISGIFSQAPKVINFVNGIFLEIYAMSKAKKIIQALSLKENCDYEIFNNVLVEKNGKNHEIDILLRLGKNVYWIEVKSGKNFYDYNEYRELGLFLGVHPNNHLLLNANQDVKTIEAISWFYDYYIADASIFESQLMAMLNKDRKEVD